ncbi:MAG: hypothetical protein IK061_03075, partial [Desulfovibrio sp.]|nr:hypothetical protein [Desulfovibrio sp.]
MESCWNREALSHAIDRFLALAESQQGDGTLTPEAVSLDLAEQTSHSPEDVQRLLGTIAWMLGRYGIVRCQGFRLQCAASGKTLALLEELLVRERKLIPRPAPRSWTRGDIRTVLASYRALQQMQLAGLPFDRDEPVYRLAVEGARSGSAIRIRMKQITWILLRHGLPALKDLFPPSGFCREGEDAMLEIYGELEAENPLRRPWSGKELESALASYRDIAELETAGLDFIVDDAICQLAHVTGRSFSDARQCLASIAWIMAQRGRRPIGSIEASGDMPAECRMRLERLVDAEVPAPARPLPQILRRLPVKGPGRPRTHGRRPGLGALPR